MFVTLDPKIVESPCTCKTLELLHATGALCGSREANLKEISAAARESGTILIEAEAISLRFPIGPSLLVPKDAPKERQIWLTIPWSLIQTILEYEKPAEANPELVKRVYGLPKPE